MKDNLMKDREVLERTLRTVVKFQTVINWLENILMTSYEEGLIWVSEIREARLLFTVESWDDDVKVGIDLKEIQL